MCECARIKLMTHTICYSDRRPQSIVYKVTVELHRLVLFRYPLVPTSCRYLETNVLVKFFRVLQQSGIDIRG